MTRVATYDPGRIKDRFAMLGGNLTSRRIELLNAKEWSKTDFTIAEDEIAEINKKHPFNHHICESNNQGWHVIDNLRRYKHIPVRPINTSKNLTAKTAKKGKSMDKNNMVEWIEWARVKGIIVFPAGQWSSGITELNRQLNRFVMKRTSTGYKYEAAEEDDHDDLVMALVIMCHFARMNVLRLGGGGTKLLGFGTQSQYGVIEENKNAFARNIQERLESNGMTPGPLEVTEDW